MWIRLLVVVLLGATAFSYSVANQILALCVSRDHLVLLGVVALGIVFFIRQTRKFAWQFQRRPMTLYSYLTLLTCVIIGFSATWWNQHELAIIAGIIYFGSLIRCGFLRGEWELVRLYGCLSFLLAWPVGANCLAFLDKYKQLTLESASALLDAFQVRNVVDADRMIGLACSISWSEVATTIWSGSALFALVAVAVVSWSLRLIHGIFILPLSILFGTAMLAGRIAFIVGMDSEEWLAWVNGCSFVIALYLSWAAMGVVRFVFDPVLGRYKSRIVPWWNRRTIAGSASMRLRDDSRMLATTNALPLQPTVGQVNSLDKTHRPARRFRRLRMVVRAFKRAFVQAILFINDWCRSRRLRRFLPLTPILFVGIAAWFSPAFRLQLAWSDSAVADLYAADVDAALSVDDRPSLDVLTRRLKQFTTLPDPASFLLAKAMVAIGQTSDAEAALAELTDDPMNPYAPAQLWQAKQLLRDPAQLSVIDRRKAMKYLRESLRDTTLAPEANWLLGQMYLQEGDDESALIHFRSIPRPLPETSLFLALIYKRRGDNTAYLRCLRNAEAACKEKLRVPDESSQQMTLLLARSLELQQRFAEAIKVLEGWTDFATDPVVRQAAIVVDIAWFESLPPAQSVERQDRIQHALAIDAKNPVLQNTLAAIAAGEATDSNQNLRQVATKEILESKKQEILSGPSLTILGTKAAELGEYEAAERLFRQAIEAGNESPLALNNLAWVLAQKSDPAATQEAFLLMNRAINMSPQSAELWKTRAEIWQQKGQILDAIGDLEKAIRFGDQSPDVRLKLAELYELQGDSETAKRYKVQVSQ